jgi:CRISPR-associated protein Cas1
MSILPSHRQGLYLLEHCRVMLKGEKLCYVRQEDAYQKFWSIPYGNTSVLLLGTGTSITQPAARLLAEEGVMFGFVGGGGTPLFLASQNEYRPTEYLQAWVSFWWDEHKRLKVAKIFQQQRCYLISSAWQKLDGITVSPEILIAHYQKNIEQASNTQQLMGYEANFAKKLYALLANHYNVSFSRKSGMNNPNDRFNSYLDHGNYLAYGLGATVLWVLGIPHAMPVSHGMTRRGALVFDVADMIKDATILPIAFQAAAEKCSDQEMRNRCIAFLDENKALPFLFNQIKETINKVVKE